MIVGSKVDTNQVRRFHDTKLVREVFSTNGEEPRGDPRGWSASGVSKWGWGIDGTGRVGDPKRKF